VQSTMSRRVAGWFAFGFCQAFPLFHIGMSELAATPREERGPNGSPREVASG